MKIYLAQKGHLGGSYWQNTSRYFSLLIKLDGVVLELLFLKVLHKYLRFGVGTTSIKFLPINVNSEQFREKIGFL